MQPNIYTYAGIDEQGTEYVLCLVNEKGQDPHYYQGRSDTKKGREKCLRLVEGLKLVIAPSSPLGLLLLATHTDEHIILRSEDEHFGVWERAGIARGRKMARFAALVLVSSLQIPKRLNEKEEAQLLSLQGTEMENLLRIGDASQAALMELVAGREDAPLVKQALSLEVKSRDGSLASGEASKEDIIVKEDSSFFSQLYHILQDLD